MSAEKARAEYGVVVGDPDATEELRERMRAERGPPSDFDFGPPIEQILARAKEETGLDPPSAPTPLPWAPLEHREMVRPQGRGS